MVVVILTMMIFQLMLILGTTDQHVNVSLSNIAITTIIAPVGFGTFDMTDVVRRYTVLKKWR